MGKFGAIRTVRQDQPASQSEDTEATAIPGPQPTPINVRGDGRPGSAAIPTFEPTTIFLRKATKKTANRTLEDSGVKQDLSELIEVAATAMDFCTCINSDVQAFRCVHVGRSSEELQLWPDRSHRTTLYRGSAADKLIERGGRYPHEP